MTVLYLFFVTRPSTTVDACLTTQTYCPTGISLVVCDKTVDHSGCMFNNTSDSSFNIVQLLTGNGEEVDGWPVNLYCLEHLILEVGAEYVSDIGALRLHDAIAKDV